MHNWYYSVFSPFAENSHPKHFLSTLHTAVFAAAVTGSASGENYRKLTIWESTIFLRHVYPVLPMLFQVALAIAVIHFTDSEEPFFSAVYSLLPPRTVICLCSNYSQSHITVFSISFQQFECSYQIDFSAKIEVSSVHIPKVRDKKKKKESKVLSSGKCAAISSPKGFFAKTISVKKYTAILFAKKYCIAFSFHEGGALSFFLFFSFENFLRSKIFLNQNYAYTQSTDLLSPPTRA